MFLYRKSDIVVRDSKESKHIIVVKAVRHSQYVSKTSEILGSHFTFNLWLVRTLLKVNVPS